MKDVINSCHGVNYTKDMALDENGYYDVEIARFARTDSQGRYVSCLTQKQIKSFKGRVMLSEYGHPRGDDLLHLEPELYEKRIKQIDERRICCELKDVDVFEISDGSQIMLAKMRVIGPMGGALQKLIDDKAVEKILFGYRITAQFKSPREVIVDQVITVDFVSV